MTNYYGRLSLSKIKQTNAARTFWFYIETYVHISIKADSLMLYNTFTGKILEYSGPSCRKAVNLVRRMLSRKNLWTIRLTETDLRDSVISEFVHNVRAHFMGDVLDTVFSRKKPVQTPPTVTIENSVRKLKSKIIRSVGEGVLEHLTEINLHINASCRQNCSMCATAYRQFPCCVVPRSGKRELDLVQIEGLLNQLASGALSRLNILGGDIFAYKKFGELTHILNHFPVHKTYFVHYKNVAQQGELLTMLNPESSGLLIPADGPLDEEKLAQALTAVQASGLEATVMFVIKDDGEFEAAEAAIRNLNIAKYDFKPFYNGKNLEFFRQNVFIEKEALLESKPTLRDIYKNGEVNSLNFGRLTIFSDGGIHASVNTSRLGVLGRDLLLDVLSKELLQGYAWRRIRKNTTPCKSCHFNHLCPPISNYAYAIGRNDLCFKASS